MDTNQDTPSHSLGRQEFGKPGDAGNFPTTDQALQLMTEWVENPKLRLHMRQVGAVLGAWAKHRLQLDAKQCELWEVAGILHDADWDKWPDEHCNRIITHLENQECDPALLHAIASHSPRFFGVEPVSDLDHMLYAFDELSGFVHAVSLVRPENYEGMSAKSVKKKLKVKSFAAQVNRDDISDALSRIDAELDDLISFVIEHQKSVTE